MYLLPRSTLDKHGGFLQLFLCTWENAIVAYRYSSLDRDAKEPAISNHPTANVCFRGRSHGTPSGLIIKRALKRKIVTTPACPSPYNV